MEILRHCFGTWDWRGRIGNLYGLHERQGLGYDLRLDGTSAIGNEKQWQVTQTAPDGFVKRYFIDPQSFLIVRDTETSALHPDIDAAQTRQETRYTDYRPVEGVLFSFLSEKFDFDKGQIVQTVMIKKFTVNPEVNEDIFKIPN